MSQWKPRRPLRTFIAPSWYWGSSQILIRILFVIFNRRLWNPSIFHCSLECDTEKKTHKNFSIILFTEQVRCLSRLRAQIRTSDLRVNFVDNISASDFNSIQNSRCACCTSHCTLFLAKFSTNFIAFY